MDSNTNRTGICLPGGKGENQEFEAYPLSSSSPEKVIHAPSQLQDQRTSEEGGPVATVLKQTRHTGVKEGPTPTPAGIPGQLYLQPPSETSTSCLSFPSGPWMSTKHPSQVPFEATSQVSANMTKDA